MIAILADPVELLGIRLVGLTAENAKKIIVSIVFVAVVLGIAHLLASAAEKLLGERARAVFWSRQIMHLASAILVILGLVSIWFQDTKNLATAAALVSAGLAFALQKVITAIAGYLVILRGKTFRVGDRIVMGDVRGDVIALGFIRTTIMEMGEPAGVQEAPPAVWVQSRQYTGRVVTVTNDKIFDTPVYNYTRDFPYIWEEMHLPVSYKDDRRKAEEILLDVANRHTVPIREISEEALREMERRFFMKRTEMGPRVYYRITDNWLELAIRFVAKTPGTRELKDRMSREILQRLEEAGIGIASATYDVVGMPPIRVNVQQPG